MACRPNYFDLAGPQLLLVGETRISWCAAPAARLVGFPTSILPSRPSGLVVRSLQVHSRMHAVPGALGDAETLRWCGRGGEAQSAAATGSARKSSNLTRLTGQPAPDNFGQVVKSSSRTDKAKDVDEDEHSHVGDRSLSKLGKRTKSKGPSGLRGARPRLISCRLALQTLHSWARHGAGSAATSQTSISDTTGKEGKKCNRSWPAVRDHTLKC